MFTEDELLEAVDILVEDYGVDEDEAINMILESSLGSAVYKGMTKTYKDVGSSYNNYNNAKNNPNASQDEIRKARNNYYGKVGKASAVTAVAGTVAYHAYKDAKKKYPRFQRRMDRRLRTRQAIRHAKQDLRRRMR